MVMDHEDEENENQVNGHDFEVGDIQDPVDGMQTHAQKNERLQNQLQMLKKDLAESRDETKETNMDKLHKENVRQVRIDHFLFHISIKNREFLHLKTFYVTV